MNTFNIDTIHSQTFNQNELLNYDKFAKTSLETTKNIKQNKEEIKVDSEYIIHRLHIDSANRNKKSSNIKDNIQYLQPYPLEFSHENSNIIIHHKNHNFETNDKISLKNVIAKTDILKNPILIKKNSFYLRIKHINHGLYYESDNLVRNFILLEHMDDLPSNFNKNYTYFDIENRFYIYNKNNDFNNKIQINGVIGNDITKSFIGNIPINYINKTHNVYLLFKLQGNDFIIDKDYYAIKLEKKATENYTEQNIIEELNKVTITFKSLYTIPLNIINADYPLNINETIGNHIITVIDEDKYSIETNVLAQISPITSFYTISNLNSIDIDAEIKNNLKFRGGGVNVYVQKVLEERKGFPRENEYIMYLNKTLKNIISITLKSSAFPNSEKSITNHKNKDNLKLYWQNLQDGSHIYSITITPGNYTAEQLASSIKGKMSQVKLINYQNEENTIDVKYDNNGHYKYNLFDVVLDRKTDEALFLSYREFLLRDTPVQQAIVILDQYLQMTTQYPLPINNNIDELFVLYTSKIYNTPDNNYEFSNNNVYRYKQTYKEEGEENIYNFELVTDKAFIFFYEHDRIVPIIDPETDLVTYEERKEMINLSYNTTTTLQNYTSFYTETEFKNRFTQYEGNDRFGRLQNNARTQFYIGLNNHNLKVGDIIVTDIFISEINDKVSVDPSRLQIPYKNAINEINTNFYIISSVVNETFFGIRMLDEFDNIKMFNDSIDQNPPNRWRVNIEKEHIFGILNVLPSSIEKKVMKIYHKNHNLIVGDVITINNSNPIGTVPQSAVNGSHLILTIIDENTYTVQLDKYKPLTTAANSGTNLVSIVYPNIFRLLFDREETLGEVLAFDKVGEENAITSYKSKISNKDEYEIDYFNDEIENRQKTFKLYGDNYFFMQIKQLPVYETTNGLEDIFAEIRYTGEPGTIVFDSFSPVIKTFNPPLQELSQLDIKFLTGKGELVDFRGVDHNFTLEIIEYYNYPNDVFYDHKSEKKTPKTQDLNNNTVNNF